MVTQNDARFVWTEFYAEVADKLLQYRHNRGPLVAAIADIERRRPELPFAISDLFADGSTGPLQDICPFTTMGLFNRSLRDDNREAIATELAQFLGVAEPTPKLSTDGNGIPLLNNQRSWFFHYASQRRADHIDGLWQVFADAIASPIVRSTPPISSTHSTLLNRNPWSPTTSRWVFTWRVLGDTRHWTEILAGTLPIGWTSNCLEPFHPVPSMWSCAIN